MRIALISDLHGNEIALDAVLEHIKAVGVDRIICLGDVATLGPRPVAVLQRLQELGCPCILGNHDEFLLDPELIHTYSEVPIILQAVDCCRAQLSDEDVAFIKTFERSLEVPLEGGNKLFLFHGTPESNMTDLLATTPPDVVDAMFAGRHAAVMAGGHTHIQMLRQHRGTLIVNPGSTGLPFKEYVGGNGGAPIILPHAEYATIESVKGSVTVHLHRIPLEKSALRDAARSVDSPLGAVLAQVYA